MNRSTSIFSAGNKWTKIAAVFCLFLLLNSFFSCGTSASLSHTPELADYPLEIPRVTKINDSTFVYGQNFLQRNRQQTWELFLTGNALQLGYNNGALAQTLIQKQENIFFDKVAELVPSKNRQWLLRKLLAYYNRNMHQHIRNDFQAEIYGLSQYSSDQYNYIAPKFLRSMYLHGAHDIGHAMQDLMLVGCSSLAVWDEKSENGDLLIGRNFDFYAGDDFAKEKITAFVKPETGIPYMYVTWPGMTGVVSGMNREGLTVTMNAGKSGIPWSAKTPVSLLAKEILQFAKNIGEAVEIAKKREVFVSESLMVGSAEDRKAVLIEISPGNFGVYDVPNSKSLICTNHFQSGAFQKDKKNSKWRAESHSGYRYERISELLQEHSKLNPQEMAEILRNREGSGNEKLGFGNEKALNQLLAHHAVIFSPEKRLVWVSTSPYQLGEMVCYDLEKIFSETTSVKSLASAEFNIPRDSFADSREFQNYERYRQLDRTIDDAIANKKQISEEFLEQYRNLNPDLWIVHYKSGKYDYEQKRYQQAKKHFETTLLKVISSKPEEQKVRIKLRKTNRKL